MSPIFTSGAFIQQCFSVHPLCLSIKKLMPPEQVILSCSSCNLAHRLTVRSFTTAVSSTGTSDTSIGQPAAERLTSCINAHRTALRVSQMNVIQETVGVRCEDCRRMFELEISLFETHQR